MGDLASRLVTAAAQAIGPVAARQMMAPELGNPDDWMPEARAAVAAVLRAFADSGDYPTDRRSLHALADAVESGAHTT